MNRLQLYAGTAVLLLGLGRAWAGEAVLVLSANGPEYQATAAGFKEGYASFGPLREINLEGSDVRQRTVGEELKASPPALAVVIGDLAAQMAQWYITGVPLVYCNVSRAAEFSFRNPRVIGVYHEPEPVEQLKMIPTLFPGKTRVGVLYNSNHVPLVQTKIAQEAKSLGLALNFIGLNSIQDVPPKLREALPQVDLLWVLTDPLVLNTHCLQYLVLQAMSAGVPIYCGDSTLARRGATAALVPDGRDAGKQAAKAAAELTRGPARAAEVMVFPKGQLILNQKIAGMLRISFSPALVKGASELIQ